MDRQKHIQTNRTERNLTQSLHNQQFFIFFILFFSVQVLSAGFFSSVQYLSHNGLCNQYSSPVPESSVIGHTVQQVGKTPECQCGQAKVVPLEDLGVQCAVSCAG